MFASGRSVPANDPGAVQLFQKACYGGNPEGYWNLAAMYITGRGVKQAPAEEAPTPASPARPLLLASH
jgi:TPR repeat protein